MHCLLIGLSSVYHTYEHLKLKGNPKYKMIKCTKIEVFKSVMEDIKEEKEIIIVVIESTRP
jgi:hypothetical protein